MAENKGDHIAIFFHDLKEEAQKLIAKAEGFEEMTEDEIIIETNWDVYPGATWPISETEEEDKK